jgi:acylphosphatase
MATRRWLVRGMVQGVGFRWFVSRQASHLGLRGFARNLLDGSVEVVAEGPEHLLQVLHEALRRGPAGAGARVDRLEVDQSPPAERVPDSFEMR